MTIAIQGLGKMGMQITQKLLSDNHQVIAYDLNSDFMTEAANLGAMTVGDKRELIEDFKSDRVIVWMMIPSEYVKNEIDEWIKILPEKSLIIDGGNSNFKDTIENAKNIETINCSMLDVGTSGGVHGLKNGFSMMVGGNNADDFSFIEPILASLAKPEGDYKYFGQAGSGHYVKMIHNAIEYGMMESLAEGFNLLKNGPMPGIDLANAATVWQHHSVITSWLNELCVDIFSENPELDGIEGYVAESGEARWTIQMAKDLQIDTPAIEAAFNVRLESQQGKISFTTKLLAAMRNSFGGHKINK